MAMVLEYMFGIAALIFLYIWFFSVFPPFLVGDFSFLNIIIRTISNPPFYLIIGFAIITELFNELKKQAKKQTQIQNQQQQQQQVITVNAPSPQQSKAPSDTIYCIQCGFKNVGMAQFCKKCGTEME